MVEVRYLTLNFLGHSTHTDLYREFNSALKEFDGMSTNCFRFLWMDLTSFLNDLAKDRVANEHHELILLVLLVCMQYMEHSRLVQNQENGK